MSGDLPRPLGSELPGPLDPSLDQAITRATAFNAAARAVSILGWIAITPYILDRLGPERFGLWSLLGTLLGLYVTFDLGLAGALTKYVAELRARGDAEALGGVFTLGVTLYAGIALAGVAAVASGRDALLRFFHVTPELRPEAAIAFVGAAAAFGLTNLWTLLGSVLGGLQRLDLHYRITMLIALLQFAGVVAVLQNGWGVPGLVAVAGFAAVAGMMLSWRAIHRLAPEIRLVPSAATLARWRSLTAYSAALQVVNLGVLVQYQLAKVLFPRFLGLAAVASYDLGFRIVFGAWSVPTVLLAPLLPAHAHLEATGDHAGIERLYQRSSRTLLGVAMPLAAALVALARVLCTAWLGPGHNDAARAASAIAALLWINVLTSAGSMVARGSGRAWIEARYHLLSMAVQLPLALAWIPRFGFGGGLAAMVVSGTVGTLYFLWNFHRALRLSTLEYARRIVAPPALASVTAGMLAWWASSAVAGGAQATRSSALAGVCVGSSVFVVIVGGILLAAGYITISGLRRSSANLLQALRGRPGGDAPA